MAVNVKVDGGFYSPFDAGKFRSSMSKGFIRNSSFMMTLSVPPGMQTGLSSGLASDFKTTSRNMQFFIESTSIPGIGLATDEVLRYGHGNVTLKPYAPIFDTLDAMVRIDAEAKTYDFFQTWIKLIINTDTRNGIDSGDTLDAFGNLQNFTSAVQGLAGAVPFEVTYKIDYASTVSIAVFDDKNDTPLVTRLIGAYPTYLGPISVSWADGREILKFPIKMAFDQWFQKTQVQDAPTG